MFFIKFPLAIQGIEHTVARYINLAGLMIALAITVGHAAEYLAVQPKPMLSPVFTFMKEKGGDSIT